MGSQRQVTPEELDRRFKYHPISDERVKSNFAELRLQFRALAEEIVTRTPPSREQALALTALEQAHAHANGAIARDQYFPGKGVEPNSGIQASGPSSPSDDTPVEARPATTDTNATGRAHDPHDAHDTGDEDDGAAKESATDPVAAGA